jgi:hypothetical protein
MPRLRNQERYRVRVRSSRHIQLPAYEVEQLIGNKLYEGEDHDLEVRVEHADWTGDLIVGFGLLFYGALGLVLVAGVVWGIVEALQ